MSLTWVIAGALAIALVKIICRDIVDQSVDIVDTRSYHY